VSPRVALALALVACGRVGFSVPADGTTGDVDDAGGADGDGAVSTYCASLSPAPNLCVDFDTGAPLETGFDLVDLSPVGATTSAVLDPLAFSGRSSVKLSLTDAPSCSYVRLRKYFASGGQELRVRFRMRPSAPWPGGQIFAHVIIGDAVRCRFLPRLRSAGATAALQVQWGEPSQDALHEWSVAPALDAWSAIAIDVIDAAGTPRVEVRMDDVTVLVVDVPQCVFGGEAHVGIGLYCASDTFEVRYDDIVVYHP
jgi:hypothetical protein